ncbi:Heat stress transcription factor A-6b [Striga hermonthica]|uniref:Heat stress transcription factor A-6b n=1 Tax=Striga hermonthica TaxID=68872 RepID=A0A9N7MXU8_STRHE|nr:Heat stress transcription factor A-6b [Striga hermonthica]
MGPPAPNGGKVEKKTEKKQGKMMRFLAKAMRNPDFIHKLVQMKEKREEIEDYKKRQRPKDFSCVKTEPWDEFGSFLQVPSVGTRATSVGNAGVQEGRKGEHGKREALGGFERFYDDDKELDEGLWDEFFSEGFGEFGGGDDDEEEEEDVKVLADRFGLFGVKS